MSDPADWVHTFSDIESTYRGRRKQRSYDVDGLTRTLAYNSVRSWADKLKQELYSPIHMA